MGRHCGYLALIAGIVSEAEFVFIPESPPETNWREELCARLAQERQVAFFGFDFRNLEIVRIFPRKLDFFKFLFLGLLKLFEFPGRQASD